MSEKIGSLSLTLASMIHERLCKGIVSPDLPSEGFSFLRTQVRLILEGEFEQKKNCGTRHMKMPATQQLSEEQANVTANDDGFVTIDLNNYEKDIAVREVVRQDRESRPVRSEKTKLVILILSLVFLGTSILMVTLLVYLAGKQKL